MLIYSYAIIEYLVAFIRHLGGNIGQLFILIIMTNAFEK